MVHFSSVSFVFFAEFFLKGISSSRRKRILDDALFEFFSKEVAITFSAIPSCFDVYHLP
jgi:hypothetical protein